MRVRSMPRIDLFDTHVSHHIVWPQDIDMFVELNNGRTLTMYDLGRVPLALRIGLIDVLKREKWTLTVAGASVRWRRRVRPFEKIEMRTRAITFDDKFAYLEQSMWKKNGECANHGMLRTAVTDKNGIVTVDRLLAAFGENVMAPPMPDWVRAWANADALRPWPPMQDGV